jgi:hypothetical protein
MVMAPNNGSGFVVGPILIVAGVVAIRFRDRVPWPLRPASSEVFKFAVRFLGPGMWVFFGILIFWSEVAARLH